MSIINEVKCGVCGGTNLMHTQQVNPPGVTFVLCYSRACEDCGRQTVVSWMDLPDYILPATGSTSDGAT